MLTIRFTFPAGRYHATPWGRHVNEGVPEWPPSPYRLLRAMYDVWQRKCAELPESNVQAVLEALASAPPRFALPAVTPTHTRGYLSANGKDPADKNLVFDPFLVFERPQACFMCWRELDLAAKELETLGLLLRNLNYLGRSESWVEAEIWEGTVGGMNAEVSVRNEPGSELMKVACAVPPSSYKGAASWMDALTFSTANLLKTKASSPPLLQQVEYSVPNDAIIVDPPRRTATRRPRVQAVLLGLDAKVLPLATTTLEVAEQVRVRLMGAHKRRRGNDESKVSPLFSGKAADGQKRLDHGHVYILPRANRAGRIDRILILSRREVFADDELGAIRGVRELYQRDGRPAVRCVVTWQGDFQASEELRLASTVESATPFVPPRHWRKGRDWAAFLDQEVRRECENHGIERELLGVYSDQTLSPFHVIEYRRNRKGDAVRPGYALRLVFREKVITPFAIGYGAHFGLGQFQATE